MSRVVLQFIFDRFGRKPLARVAAGAAIGGYAMWEAAAVESGRLAPGACYVLGGAFAGSVAAALLTTCESIRLPSSTSAGGRAAYSALAAAAVVLLFAMLALLAVMTAALLSAR